MLKLKTFGVNFINMFTRSFYTHRSQKRKRLLELTVFFALLGSAGVKAACKHVDEIDPCLLHVEADAMKMVTFTVDKNKAWHNICFDFFIMASEINFVNQKIGLQ